jgi:hypothetical protein
MAPADHKRYSTVPVLYSNVLFVIIVSLAIIIKVKPPTSHALYALSESAPQPPPPTGSMQLFVLNDKEEFVCHVRAEPPLHAAPAKLLVVSYTRDPSITGPGYEARSTLKPASPEDERKFGSFLGYMKDRQKTAVIKLNGQETLLYAHPRQPARGGVEMVIYAKKTQALPPAAASAPGTSSGVGGAALASTSALSAQKPKAAAAGAGGFLSNLLGKVSCDLCLSCELCLIAKIYIY